MASTAFIELGLATDLFEKGAQFSRRARSGMASIILTIRYSAINYIIFRRFCVSSEKRRSRCLLSSGAALRILSATRS